MKKDLLVSKRRALAHLSLGTFKKNEGFAFRFESAQNDTWTPATAGDSKVFFINIRVFFLGRLEDYSNALIELVNNGLFGLVHFEVTKGLGGASLKT